MGLTNKTAVVTGAASGIGKAIAMRLAKEGAKVIIIDNNEHDATCTAQGIVDAGGQAMAYQADVRDSSQINDIVANIIENDRGIDILVNNAGIYYQLADGSNQRSRFVDSREATWRLVTEVNLIGTMIVTHAVLQHMVPRQKGKIVNIGSVAGVNGIANMVDYSASKGGIIAFTHALAIELGEYQINVNCVSPGSIDVNRGGPQTFLRRMGRPDEVANLVYFLSCDESDFITGKNYIIDGGRVLSMKCD